MFGLTMNARPVGRPSIFNKEEAKKIACHLFWQHGYEETSLTDLTQAMGINRSSFYRAFESKEALFHACVETYMKEELKFIPAALAQPNIKDCMTELLSNSVHLMTMHTPARGCLIVQGIVNCSDQNQAIANYLKQKRMQLENLVRKRVQQAQVKQEIKSGQSAVDITKTVMTLYCGLSIQAASGTNQKELINVAKLILKMIDI